MFKVLHITTDFIPGTGGLERFILDLAVHSRSAGIEPSVLALNKIAGSDEALPPEAVVCGLLVHRVRFLDLRYYKPTWLPIHLMRQADVLHVHGIGALLDFVVATKAIHRKPIVLSTHGGIFHNAALSGVKNAYFGFVRTMVLPFVDRIVACGEADRQLFADHGVREMITIDNGIDLRPFMAPSPGNPGEGWGEGGLERKEGGHSRTDPNHPHPNLLPDYRERGPDDDASRVVNRLLFVGRISPNKSVDQLIRALAEVRRAGTPATLRIVGPDRYRLNEGLRNLAVELGIGDAVSIVGEIADTDLPGEYQQTDLFVSASRHEGFGISTVEAMAAGAVPLLNDIPAFRYLLKTSSGQPAGALCDFANAAAAAAAIMQLLSADRSAMRAEARARAADFSWDRLIPRWREVYEAVS